MKYLDRKNSYFGAYKYYILCLAQTIKVFVTMFINKRSIVVNDRSIVIYFF